MKKQIKILMLAVMLILTSTLTLIVNAADAIVTLNPDKAQVHAGDTFVVTMNVACEEGINGLQGNVSYDTTKLELVSIAVADTTKWFNLGENSSLAIIHNSSDTETSADIVKVTLKVKDTAEVGTATVTISDIVVDSDAASNSMKQVGTKEIQVSVVEETTDDGNGDNNQGDDNNNTPGTDDEGQDNNNTGTGDNDNQDNNQGNNDDSSNNENEGQDNDNTSTGNNNENKEDNEQDNKDEYEEIKDNKDDDTKSENKMPDTGVSSVIGMMIIITVFGVFALVRYNKYKEI